VAVRNHRLATLILFVALAAAHTWPLALAPGTWSRNDHADALLNTWILAWVAHILPQAPLSLFDANIFHPEPTTLAYSEHLVVPALMGAPLAWAGASPVLVHNLVLLAGLALTGWTTCLVLTRWTGDTAAGVFAGTVAAFNAHTLTRLPHVQASHVEFLPLALLALDRVIAHRRVRDALALAGWYVLQALCSGYLLLLAATALAAGALSRVDEWARRDRAVRTLALLALAGTLAVALCLPFLLPYAQVRREQGLVRPIDEVAGYSATVASYLSTGARLHFSTWSEPHYRRAGESLFPGVAPLLLACAAILSGLAWRDRRARMLLATTVVGLLFSFGPRFEPYRTLYEHLPLLQGLRAAARYGYLVVFGIGAIGAFALAAWRARLRSGPRSGPAVAVAAGLIAVVAANLDAWRAPLEYTRYHGIPRTYATLARLPRAVVAEFPFHSGDSVHRNAPYVFASTAHWRPLVNGYSGFIPPSLARHAAAFGTFPDTAALDALRAAGVTHVVVHPDAMPVVAGRLRNVPRLQLVADDGTVRVYELSP
jgi:hypothetical protein